MDMEETAQIILSGEHSRRRGYLTNVIAGLNVLAITATISIWGFFIHWDSLLNETKNHKLFAIQLAWASGLSSIFLGLWRLYARFLDAAIIQLYPAIYLCEVEILPEEICSIKNPKNITRLTKELILKGIKWIVVRNKDFGGRGHGVIDWIVVIIILLFVFANLATGFGLDVIEINSQGTRHLVTYLLFFNVVGILLVLIGWLKWRNKKVKWPIPKKEEME